MRACGLVEGARGEARVRVQLVPGRHPSARVRDVHPQAHAAVGAALDAQAVVDLPRPRVVDGHHAVRRQVEAAVRVPIRRRRAQHCRCRLLSRSVL